MLFSFSSHSATSKLLAGSSRRGGQPYRQDRSAASTRRHGTSPRGRRALCQAHSVARLENDPVRGQHELPLLYLEPFGPGKREAARPAAQQLERGTRVPGPFSRRHGQVLVADVDLRQLVRVEDLRQLVLHSEQSLNGAQQFERVLGGTTPMLRPRTGHHDGVSLARLDLDAFRDPRLLPKERTHCLGERGPGRGRADLRQEPRADFIRVH